MTVVCLPQPGTVMCGSPCHSEILNARFCSDITTIRQQNWRTEPSVLWHCWLGVRKSTQPVKNWMMRCLRGYLSAARCRLLAYGLADATAIPKIPSFLASCKSRLVLPFWYWFIQVVLEKMPLSVCSSSKTAAQILLSTMTWLTTQLFVFNLLRAQCCMWNQFSMSHGRCASCMKKWGPSSSQLCNMPYSPNPPEEEMCLGTSQPWEPYRTLSPNIPLPIETRD